MTLVCGASGVGKSHVARALALRYGTPLAEADDIVTALGALTTPDQAPELHFWNTHPEASAWPPERIVEQHFRVVEALTPGLRAVVNDHIEFQSAVVIEGDYLVPELASGFGSAVRAVVIAEPDEVQIVENFRSREPDEPAQQSRARVSLLVEAELTRRGDAVGAPVVLARPWDTAVHRADEALRALD
ncbi:MAG TPA: AAA family ATPase [Acidimicrobiia bacterium]|nr:AAA family ATPase [Acidimicrobiia bacterium]